LRARPADHPHEDRARGAVEGDRSGLQGSAVGAGISICRARADSAALTARWQAEKNKINAETKIKEQLDAARTQLDQAQRTGDLARAGELSYGTIPALEKQLAEAEGAAKGAMVREEVTSEDIAGVVGRWTGIPVERMLEGERDKLLRMEEAIGKRVIGQADAVAAVSPPCGARARVCRIRTGLWVRSCSSGRRAWARPS
jgi:ATP-dependent Clp protease ATP-binding subunit ClpA